MDRAITLDELNEIWEAYVEFRKPQVSPSTVVRDYEKISRRIRLIMQTQPDLDNAKDIREWLLCNYSREIARRTLQQFGAACKWAQFQDLLPWNPFDQMGRYLFIRSQDEDSFVAFTATEKEEIIRAFKHDYPDDVPWVRFQFMTGCRPEESAALKWKHVAKDLSQIHIREARPVDTGIVQATKTRLSTRFPCNIAMIALLQDLAANSHGRNPEDYLFKGRKGGPFDYKNFQRRRWKPTIEELVEKGLVAFYMPQYNTRHTFITNALRHLDVKDVSYLCRVSVATLQRVYVSRSRLIDIPEF